MNELLINDSPTCAARHCWCAQNSTNLNCRALCYQSSRSVFRILWSVLLSPLFWHSIFFLFTLQWDATNKAQNKVWQKIWLASTTNRDRVTDVAAEQFYWLSTHRSSLAPVGRRIKELQRRRMQGRQTEQRGELEDKVAVVECVWHQQNTMNLLN